MKYSGYETQVPVIDSSTGRLENYECMNALHSLHKQGRVYLKRELRDMTLVFVEENGEKSLYVLSRIKNRLYFSSLVETIFGLNQNLANMTRLWNGDVIKIANIEVINMGFGMTDLSYWLLNIHFPFICERWIVKKINLFEDSLFTSLGVIYIGQDKLLKKIKIDGIDLFLKSSYGNNLTQDFYNGVQNEKMMFFDPVRNEHFGYENISGQKVVEALNKEIKNKERRLYR